MVVSPVQGSNPVSQAAQAAPRVAKHPEAQSGPKKDTAIISEKAKDLAAQLSGKIAAEEAKESPVVEAREEQGKSHH